MLYERWRQIAHERAHQTALLDFSLDQRWTFSELDTVAGKPPASDEPMAFPQGATSEFIFTVLRAWRFGRVVCPLEVGQVPPKLNELPPGCVHLKTTSATAGAPRLVAFTAEQLAADADNIVATMGLRAHWPNLGVISLAHSYGFSNLVLPLLLHGIPLVLAGDPLPETVRRAAASSQFVTLPAVPALWRTWHDADAIPRNVRLAISAGAPLPLPLEHAVFAARGLKIHNFYGASECGGIAYDFTPGPRTDGACVGAPMKNVQASIADDGCLQVRSRAVAEGYWWGEATDEPARGDARPTNSTLGGGCFHTSDLAEIAFDFVYLRGRAGDQINVAGRKISPEAIEKVLLAHPCVRECLVFGVPSRDAQRTEDIVAVVVFDCTSTLAPKSSPSPRSEAELLSGRARQSSARRRVFAEPRRARSDAPYQKKEREFSFQEREGVLRRFVLETLPAWQAPRHWWFVEAVQTNPRGKVSRAEWRERWLARMK